MNLDNMSPEAIKAVNEMCSAENIGTVIRTLMAAEEEMQKTAFAEYDGTLDYLFRRAYELRVMREKFEELEKALGYEPDRE